MLHWPHIPRELLAEALRRTRADRARLAEELLSSLEESDEEVASALERVGAHEHLNDKAARLSQLGHLQYRTGEMILQGDVVEYHGDRGHVEFVVNALTGDPSNDWHFQTNGPGVMVVEPKHFGPSISPTSKTTRIWSRPTNRPMRSRFERARFTILA